jgi:YwqJ-like deaminase
VITADEARLIAERWVAESGAAQAGVHEFDVGYVVWGLDFPAIDDTTVGAGRGVIDKETGELSVWPSIPVEAVAAQYAAQRAAEPPAPRSWDPAEQARRDLRRLPVPAAVTHLTVGDRLLIARSAKGDGTLIHHPLVADFLAALPVEHRERGYPRCSEAVALSDALHAEDALRQRSGAAPITLDEARTGLFRGADLVTYRVREAGDPVAGQPAPPCASCLQLLDHLGFALVAP